MQQTDNSQQMIPQMQHSSKNMSEAKNKIAHFRKFISFCISSVLSCSSGADLSKLFPEWMEFIIRKCREDLAKTSLHVSASVSVLHMHKVWTIYFREFNDLI